MIYVFYFLVILGAICGIMLAVGTNILVSGDDSDDSDDIDTLVIEIERESEPSATSPAEPCVQPSSASVQPGPSDVHRPMEEEEAFLALTSSLCEAEQ